MFYEIKNLTCSVDLAPQYFGPRLKEAVARLVVEKVQWSRITHETVEGFAVHAYVPDIGSYDLTKGKIHEDTGAVQFHVKYVARGPFALAPGAPGTMLHHHTAFRHTFTHLNGRLRCD